MGLRRAESWGCNPLFQVFIPRNCTVGRQIGFGDFNFMSEDSKLKIIPFFFISVVLLIKGTCILKTRQWGAFPNWANWACQCHYFNHINADFMSDLP